MRLALLVLLAACWTGSTTPAEPPPEPPPSAFAITMERTPCFGDCPVYAVSIDGDGRVRWKGLENVHDVGVRRATVPPKRVAELKRTLDKLQFFERDASGDLPAKFECTRTGNATECSFSSSSVICSGTSTAVLRVRDHGRTHTVRNDHCDPSPLDELEALIDDVARTSAWIGKRVTQ